MTDRCSKMFVLAQVVYQDVLLASDSGTLEELKELSSKRKAMEESINQSSSVTEAVAREMSGGLTSRCEQVKKTLLFECIFRILFPF